MVSHRVNLSFRDPASPTNQLDWAVLLIGLFLLGDVLSAAPVQACSCAETDTEEALASAVSIFEGRVMGLEGGEVGGDVRVTFRVVQAWKGDVGEEVTVATSASGASCGYGFELQRGYLVYTYAADGGEHVSLCSRTRPIEEADEDLAALGAGVTPVTVGSGAGSAPPSPVRESPPASGGCASCAIGAGARSAEGSIPAGLAVLALVAMAASRRRR